MSEIKVTCYKGAASADDSRVFQFDSADVLLPSVRERLTNEGFLPKDNLAENIEFLFVKAKFDPKTKEDKKNLGEAALVQRDDEQFFPLWHVLGDANQLIATNHLTEKKPDLIGIGTDWFFDRYLGVQISLNVSDPEGKATNDQIKAFAPMMLTNVHPTSKNTTGVWDNVCVCVEKSVVTFTINSWGAAGFQFAINDDRTDPICTDLLVSLGNDPNRYASTSLDRYESKSQTIQIVGADSQQIFESGEKLRFQKVTVKTRRMTSYKKDGQKFSSDQMPKASRSRVAVPGFYAHTAAALAEQKDIVRGSKTEVVAGDSIKPAGPVEGPPSQQEFGKIRDVHTDDWSQALGEVVIYFFVFNNWEAANRVINGYNAPDPNLWS